MVPGLGFVAAALGLRAVPADVVALLFGQPSISPNCSTLPPLSYVLSFCCVCIRCTLSSRQTNHQ